MRCPTCGTEVEPTANFCKECGTKLQAAQDTEAPAAVAAQSSPVAPSKTCPNGHPMDPSWTVCPRCIETTLTPLPPTRIDQSATGHPQATSAAQVAMLIGLSGDFQGRTLNLPEGETIIGADPSCTIVLNDQYISGRHASLTIEGNRFVLTDLNSRNGTFVNNTRITHVELRDNDKIRFGVDPVFQFKRLR